MDQDGFLTETELKEKIKEEEFFVNLSSFNRFLLNKYMDATNQLRIEQEDEVMKVLTDENLTKDAVRLCIEQTQESNQKIDYSFRSVYKLLEVLKNYGEEQDNEDALMLAERLHKQEDVYLYEIYELAEKHIDSAYLRRMLIALRDMQMHGRG